MHITCALATTHTLADGPTCVMPTALVRPTLTLVGIVLPLVTHFSELGGDHGNLFGIRMGRTLRRRPSAHVEITVRTGLTRGEISSKSLFWPLRGAETHISPAPRAHAAKIWIWR